MDEYEWQLNRAIVDRLYYTERVWETTTVFGGIYTMMNYNFMRRNYFSSMARGRIAPTWAYIIGFNLAVTFIMVKPLDMETEIKPQMRKRLAMGKWLYSTFHLDEDIKYADTRIF